jgi:formylmethanofuran dehydrogenase subunit B
MNELSHLLSGHRSPQRKIVCAGCSCFCDDIEIDAVSGDCIGKSTCCDLCQTFFGRVDAPNKVDCRVNGESVSTIRGIEVAHEILTKSKFPVFFGLGESVSEDQQAICRLAKKFNGVVDAGTGTQSYNSIRAFQCSGNVTCTYGEVRNRADLILFWGSDPVTRQPRHLERISLNARGRFVPRGRSDRTCIVVDSEATPTSAVADYYLQILPDTDLHCLITMRAILNGRKLQKCKVKALTGIELEIWEAVVERMSNAKYGVVFYGERFGTGVTGFAEIETLSLLTRDLNRSTRFSCIAAAGETNVVGAENVLTWQTGYPGPVRFGENSVEFQGEEFCADQVLNTKEADAALVFSQKSIERLTSGAIAHLRTIPLIVFKPEDQFQCHHLQPSVQFKVPRFGRQTHGTIYRNDHVPLPVRPIEPVFNNTISQLCDAMAIAK